MSAGPSERAAIAGDYLSAVHRGIDYIEAHLDEEIALGDVGHAAGMSQWHFQRIFKALTNETLKTYIRSRRMAAVLEPLRDPGRRIIDIALAAGFESQASFTRAFRTIYHMTPGDYRQIGRRNVFPTKARFDASYIGHLHRGMTLEPSLERWEAQRVVGMATTFRGIASDKNNMASQLFPLWADFMARMHEIDPGARVAGNLGYGLLRPASDESDELCYVACVPVTRGVELPRGMLQVELPPARYACFTHRGPLGDLDHTVNYAYGSWLLTSGMKHSGDWDVEIYGEDYKPDDPDSVIRYAMPLSAVINEAGYPCSRGGYTR